MDIYTLSAIAVASALNSAMPGPCVAMTIGRSARDGFPAGMLVSTGVVMANLILCAAALAVMHGLIALSPTTYVFMKWAGIAALVVLALRMLLYKANAPTWEAVSDRRQFGDLSLGLLVGLSSPFNLIFLLALLPQLVPATDQSAATMIAVTLAVLVGAAVSLCGAVFIGLSASMVRGASHHIERVCALSMIAFAGLAGTTPIV